MKCMMDAGPAPATNRRAIYQRHQRPIVPRGVQSEARGQLLMKMYGAPLDSFYGGARGDCVTLGRRFPASVAVLGGELLAQGVT